jgi:hypothetical protein
MKRASDSADSKGSELDGKKARTEIPPPQEAISSDSVYIVTVRIESRGEPAVHTEIIAVCDSHGAAVAASKKSARDPCYFDDCDKEYWENGDGSYSTTDDEVCSDDYDDDWTISVGRHKVSSRCDFPESSDEEDDEEDEEEELEC